MPRAAEVGVVDAVVRKLAARDVLERRAQGVYRIVAFPLGPAAEYMEAVLWAKGRGVIGGEAALVLWDLADVNPRRIDVVVPNSYRPRRQGGDLYRVHRADLGPDEVDEVDGVPVVTPAVPIRQGIRDGVTADLVEQAIRRAEARELIGRQTAARLAVALYDRPTTPTKKAATRWRVAPADGISRKQSCEATTAGCVGEDLHTQSTKSPGLASAPGPLSARGTSAACRRLMNVTRLVVELDDDAARRLAERAEREGIEPSALARRLLSEASEVDPFEFIGSFASHAANGRDADEFLDREGFGAP